MDNIENTTQNTQPTENTAPIVKITNLAKIVKITALNPIPKKDRIEAASLNGMYWTCVVKKGEFQVGDLGVYFFPDTVVDSSNPSISFMKDRKDRVRSCKYGGVMSSGLLMPLKTLNYWLKDDSGAALSSFVENYDVSELVNSQKWTDPSNLSINTNNAGNFPNFVGGKSDEDNLKSYSEAWNELLSLDQPVYMSIKMDGASQTVYYQQLTGELGTQESFGVCSRSFLKTKDENSPFWVAANRYNLETTLPEYCKKKNVNLALRGECCGPKMNGNKMGLGAIDLFIYGVFDITNQRYYGYYEMMEVIKDLNLKPCPLLYLGVLKDKYPTINHLLDFINPLKYDNGEWIEGVVIRPINPVYSPTLNKGLSVKLINENFEVKYL